MSDKDKLTLLKTMAALPEEDQRSMAFFVAGMVAGKSSKKEGDENDAGANARQQEGLPHT